MEYLKEVNKILFKCDICDKEFKKINVLRHHYNIVHKLMEEHQCNICQKDFKLLRQLREHVKIVHENKKHHKCNWFKVIFITRKHKFSS